MRYLKIGENRHGNIWAVFHKDIQIGTVEKWSELFIAKDPGGTGFAPTARRHNAARKLKEAHEAWERGE